MSFSEWPGYRPGHHWTVREDDDRPTFSRPLGVLEQRFDIASSQKGQSDTFVRLDVDLEASGASNKEQRSRFVFRLLIAWSRLRAKHPLLGATIEDMDQVVIPGCPARRFNYEPPQSASEALLQASNTLLFDKTDDLRSRMDEIQDKYVLNGERVLLKQSECLSRLILVESRSKFGFFLVISHVVSWSIPSRTRHSTHVLCQADLGRNLCFQAHLRTFRNRFRNRPPIFLSRYRPSSPRRLPSRRELSAGHHLSGPASFTANAAFRIRNFRSSPSRPRGPSTFASFGLHSLLVLYTADRGSFKYSRSTSRLSFAHITRSQTVDLVHHSNHRPGSSSKNPSLSTNSSYILDTVSDSGKDKMGVPTIQQRNVFETVSFLQITRSISE